MVFAAVFAQTDATLLAPTERPDDMPLAMKAFTIKFLHKLATVTVTLLLYFVIAILQKPGAARAAEGTAQSAPACTIAPKHI